MRLMTIEWEMSYCQIIKRSRKEHHLRNAETYCDEASVVVSKSLSIEGALEEVKHYRDKISRRRVRLNEDGKKGT